MHFFTSTTQPVKINLPWCLMDKFNGKPYIFVNSQPWVHESTHIYS